MVFGFICILVGIYLIEVCRRTACQVCLASESLLFFGFEGDGGRSFRASRVSVGDFRIRFWSRALFIWISGLRVQRFLNFEQVLFTVRFLRTWELSVLIQKLSGILLGFLES